MTSHPFDSVLGEGAPEFRPDDSVNKFQRWEHKVVGRLLEHYGIKARAAEIAALTDGPRRLTFQGFRSLHPTFPVWLACRKVPFVHQTTMTDFFRNWKKTKLWRAYEAAEADAPEAYREGRCGLVFEWLHVCPMMIIHNYAQRIRVEETMLFRLFCHTDPPQLFAVQSFSSFMGSLPWVP